MKKLFCLLLIVSSFAQAQANLVFRTDSVVPSQLQDLIIQTVQSQCIGIAQYSLMESKSFERIDRIDQGIIDRYYTTYINAQFYFDGQHSSTVIIEVNSLISAGFDPAGNEKVLSVSSHDIHCK